MKTKQLIQQVSDITGWERREVSDIVLVAIEVMAEALTDGETVKLKGLGRLAVKKRADCLVMKAGIPMECEIRGPRVLRFKGNRFLEQEINRRHEEVL
jgi:nucleoid DNA-binding protein